MNTSEITNLMRAQARVAGLQNVDDLVTNAIALAGPFAWKAHPWQFKRREKTITTSTSTEYVELPDDFGGFVGLTYSSGSTEGWKLRYYAEDTYELYFPNPSILSEDAPRICKIVKDYDSNKWRAYFTPIPDSAYSLSLIYSRDWGNIEDFPGGFEDLVLSAAWIFMYPGGSEQKSSAQINYRHALRTVIDDIDPIHRARVDTVRRASRFQPHEGGGEYSDPADYFIHD